MQSDESARRIIDIGAPPERVKVTGSLKFDSLEFPDPADPRGRALAGRPSTATVPDRGRNRVLRFFRISPNRPVVIAASTLKGEEEPVLEAFQRIRSTMTTALLIIAPRKPERFDEVERLARRGGWNVARRSELRVDSEPRHDVVILDTIGELAQLFQIATTVFVGGMTACTPNESEVEQLFGIRIGDNTRILERAGRNLLDRTRAGGVLITRGSRGMALFERGRPTVHIPIFGSDQNSRTSPARGTPSSPR